jgi:cytochrome oxidase Cu insertion factor (SCO1/SenC/PrrC family)
MSRPIKILTLLLWVVAVTGMVWVVAMQLWTRDRHAAQAAATADTVVDATPITAPRFSLTDQLGRTVTTDDLKGHPWIADFFFTTCASSCPMLTKHLSDLQTLIPGEVKFISFSVDPDHDTPAALLAYAKLYNADNDRWRFLTGEKSALFAAITSLKVTVVSATKDNPIEHDVHYLLMDSAGRLQNVYDSRSPDEVSKLVHDATALTAAQAPPAATEKTP